MKRFLMKWCAVALLLVPVAAQAESKSAVADKPPPRAKMSTEGRAALKRCREIAAEAKGLRGRQRAEILANAASAYDRVAGGFGSESVVAAAAAFAAAELWRRHGSLPLAEDDYLLAARVDAARFGPRGWLGAADMQRRLKRSEEAIASYRKAIAADASSSHAQRARLSIAGMFRDLKRLEDAVAMGQVALECARPGRQTIDAANQLALSWLAKGDLDAAGRAIGHAEASIEGVDNGDPVTAERLRKAVRLMSARRALRRALDREHDATGDAVRLDAARRGG